MIVIDSSIVIKWFFPEDDSDKAEQLLQNETFCAPDLLIYEFTNYVVRRPFLEHSDASFLFRSFDNTNIKFFMIPIKGLIEITKFCKKFNVSAYDASFIILAQLLGLDFLTADIKLLRKVHTLRFVRAL